MQKLLIKKMAAKITLYTKSDLKNKYRRSAGNTSALISVHLRFKKTPINKTNHRKSPLVDYSFAGKLYLE